MLTVPGDPTPYYLASKNEHGGKENDVSTYSLGIKSSPVRTEMTNNVRPMSSPDRPKPSTRQSVTTNDARKVQRTTTQPTSTPLSHQNTTKERHSRKSIHSRTQSRHSSTLAKKREHSRTQSTAYPFFDALDVRRSSIGNAINTAADAICTPEWPTKAARDMSGNLTF